MVKKVTAKRRRRKQNGQIFVNASGGRRQLLRLVALAVGCVCLGFLLLLAAALSGVIWQDDTEPPGTAELSTTGSAPVSGSWSGAQLHGAGVSAPLATAPATGGSPW